MTTGSSALQPYLPRLIRYWDIDAPGQLHRAIDGSMVFVDISGFTKLSEKLARHGNEGAEEITAVIDNTFGQLLPEAYQFGANLLKFGGDAMLLFFTGADHSPRAAAGAFAMRAKLREIGETAAAGVRLGMTSGVHSGTFDFFLIGGTHRELIVAGPAITRTVEMETAANTAQIMISPETAAALSKGAVGKATGPGYLLKRLPATDPLGFQPATSPEINLGQFVPTALCSTLLEGAVHAEHRPAAVAFINFTGFDGFLRDRGGDATAKALLRLVEVVQEAVERHEVSFLATDISNDGGKIVLSAGVPNTAGNDEEQMLLAMRETVDRADSDLPIRIGINSGNVFSGPVGPTYRRTYTVMGDTVNLAARLMAKAPAGEIYTTAAVLESSRTTFRTRALEPFYVKGKARPIQAFSVGDPEGSRSANAGSGLPLVGRDRELATIRAAWASANEGKGRVIEIVAEAGMGKSRLLEEILTVLQPERLSRAECRLYQTATPYFPFRSLLRTSLGITEADPAAASNALAAVVLKNTPELEPWLALIGVPMGLDLPASPQVQQLEDEFRQARTSAAVTWLLTNTVDEPALFIIEDNHWMDNASLELLTEIVGAVSTRPWLFVLTRRPGDRGFVAQESEAVSRLELQPISVADARALIRQATEDVPILPATIDALAERAQGNPLFLIELLRALRAGGDVEALPHSIEGLIAARIDRLGPSDRNLLRRVAVLGNGFRIEHATAVVQDSIKDVRGIATAARRLEDFINVDRNGWVQFRHVLIRDVAYEGLPFKTRRELHSRIGDSICSGTDHPERESALLSNHYSRAHRWEEAWRFSRLAGDSANEIYANSEAAIFYRRALAAARHIESTSAVDKSEVSEALGDVLLLAGHFDESVAAFSEANRFAIDPIRHGDLLLKRAQARARKGAYAPAFRDLTRGRHMVDEVESEEAMRARARLTAQTAWLRQLQERPRIARDLAEQAVAEAEASGEEEALARALQTLDAAYIMLGQPSKAVYSERALEIYDRLGNQSGVAIITNNLGAGAYFEGHWDESVKYYARAQEAFKQVGNDAEAATSGANIGEVLVSQGKYEEADEILSEAVRLLRAHNLLDAAIFADIQLTRLHLLQGNPSAIEALAELRDEALSVGQTQSAIEASIYMAQGMVRIGQAQEALDLLANARRNHRRDAELYGCPLARVSADALTALGRFDEAAKEIADGLEQARSEGLVYEEALLLKSAAALANGEEKEELLEKARGLLQQLGVVNVA